MSGNTRVKVANGEKHKGEEEKYTGVKVQSKCWSKILENILEEFEGEEKVKNGDVTKPKACFCCGGVGHLKYECEYLKKKCETCGKEGHTGITCWCVK